jgi:hypothetical protein
MKEQNKFNVKELRNEIIGYKRVKNALDEDQYVPITFGGLAICNSDMNEVYQWYVSLHSSLAALNQKYQAMKKEGFNTEKLADIYLEQIVLENAIRIIDKKPLYALRMSDL